MIRRPPRSTLSSSSAASDVYKRQCIDQFEKDKIYSDPIVTEINIECPFYPAEVEHHNYYNRNSEQPHCHYVITPKIKKLESLFKQYTILELSLIHISEPTRQAEISYAVFCLKKKKKKQQKNNSTYTKKKQE